MPSESRIVLITGANSGVGFATAKVLTASSSSYHVIIGARNPAKGAEALKTLQVDPNTKGSLSTIYIDSTDESSITAAAEEVKKRFGRLDALINNAGIYLRSENLAWEMETQFKTNVVGPALTTRAFMPLLLKSEKPYLVYISSSLGSLGTAEDPGRFDYRIGAIGYRVSKLAMNMVMLEEHKEFGSQGVKVFSVCPGLVESNLRGPGEQARTAGGDAGPAEESGILLLNVLEGKKDDNAGKFLYKDGVRPW
ncbi:putative short chain dehydrogenase/reductase [Talaromyces proteolyticus]|uniref:Short chain dehydrogenase/reductase n=1 Tax=Talaromyces proteolyticus TaxID=1131652 RepID=A0AAD4PZT1_9EURO|nr:putative short chain dehydrogenase/reductase [Talaromyces proteolyticus]KAH8703338.1 putative short chain dehydrogenase/reductase [Talaromyces proteolyticus]